MSFTKPSSAQPNPLFHMAQAMETLPKLKSSVLTPDVLAILNGLVQNNQKPTTSKQTISTNKKTQEMKRTFST